MQITKFCGRGSLYKAKCIQDRKQCHQGQKISDNLKTIQLITHLCPTLCDPMSCSMPGSLSITNSSYFLRLMSIESVRPFNNLNSAITFSSCLQSLPASRSFPVSQFFESGGQMIGVSASASVLPMNIQY